MATLSAYEKERLERIAKNQELLQSLQLDRLARTGTPDSINKDKPSKAKPKPRPKKETAEVIRPARVTRSNAVRTAALEYKDPEAAKRKREQEEREEREAEELKRRKKHEPREIEVWNPTGRELWEPAIVPLKRSLESIATSGSWPRQLHPSIRKKTEVDAKVKTETNGLKRRKSASASPSPNKRASRKSAVKKEESDEEKDVYLGDSGSKDSISYKSLTKTFNNLTLRATKRTTADRIYSALIHPTTDKDLIFTGDRKGWLGIWDATADTEEPLKSDEQSDEEDEDYDKNCFVQRIFNDHGTIACMRLDPLKAHTIYTSSYDCTIRSLNFETGVWQEAVDVDLHAADDHGVGEALISGFEIVHNGNIIWASDNSGGVTLQDLREPTSSGKRWKISESKAGCISINPANENYFATAHLNRDVRLWDARKITDIKDWKSADYHDLYSNACVASFEHGKACSSAYWDPSGKHLLTTSYDDLIRVWNLHPQKLTEEDLKNFEPDYELTHDNNVGAYTSVFKATWSPNVNLQEPFFTVGNMKRSLDIYDKQGRTIRKLNQGLTSVPAVTVTHNTLPVFIGGATAGKTYYWKADRWE